MKYLRAASKCFGCGNLHNSMYQGGMSEQRSLLLDQPYELSFYGEAVSHWNIAVRPRSGLLAELKFMARAAFWHEMKFMRENKDQLRSQSMLTKRQRGKCHDFWRKIKSLIPKKESLPLTVGVTSAESNIANLWKDHLRAIANFVGSGDIRDLVIHALRTVPGKNDVTNVHELQQIVRGLKDNKSVECRQWRNFMWSL